MLIIYIVCQITSMAISSIIKSNTSVNSYKKIGDNGFKIDFEKLHSFTEKNENENNKIDFIIDSILFFIPGVNIINAKLRSSHAEKMFYTTLTDAKALIPLTDDEKKYYDHLDGKIRKATFISYKDVIDKEINKIKEFIDDETEVLERHIAQLYYEKMPPIAYTLDEIKQLSKSIDSSYKIGTVEGVNTAIIGLPNEECIIDKIILKNNDKLEKYDYQPIENEETAKFVVYPFGIDFNENDKLKECYKKIIDKRDNDKKQLYNNVTMFNHYQTDDKQFVRVKRK